ncbi:MAG: hypothetical protein R3F37_01515 [Candidatus Competibacteraceae bacterium]
MLIQTREIDTVLALDEHLRMVDFSLAHSITRADSGWRDPLRALEKSLFQNMHYSPATAV